MPHRNRRKPAHKLRWFLIKKIKGGIILRKLLKCPSCGHDNLKKAIFCEKCSAILSSEDSTTEKHDVSLSYDSAVSDLRIYSPSNLTSKAWVCFIAAILSLPLFIIGYFLRKSPDLKTLEFAFSVIETFLDICIYISFRNLLNSCFNYYKVDNVISGIIIIDILATILERLNLGLVISIILLVVNGVLYLILGLRLQKFKYKFDGLLKKYCTICICKGVFTILVILCPLTIICSIFEYSYLGLMFMHMEKQLWLNQDKK
jgi:hypothetical protein